MASVNAESPDVSTRPPPPAEDLYEDAGDLEFYNPNEDGDPFGSVYLARVPHWLWEAWDRLDDDEEIRLGTLRQWISTNSAGQSKYHLKMLLRSDLAVHQHLPKEHKLEITDFSVANTFLFSEEDLPAFRARNRARALASAAGIPDRLQREKEWRDRSGSGVLGGGNDEGVTGRNRRERVSGQRVQANYKKAIPKKTKIFGRVKHEIQCVPDQNAEYQWFMQRQSDEMRPKSTTQIASAGQASAQLKTGGTIGAQPNAFTNFIRNNTGRPPPKQTRREHLDANRTARIPENELLDLIFGLFRKYTYWSLKSMRERIPQPEVYLRATLEKVADLHKTGTYANTWSLKQENQPLAGGEAELLAPEVGQGEGESEEEEMEDVFPG